RSTPRVTAAAPPAGRLGQPTTTRPPTPAPAASTSGAPSIGGCPVFPADNPWNRDISTLPVDANSAAYINAISASGARFLHPDFGSDPSYGIPYVVVRN